MGQDLEPDAAKIDSGNSDQERDTASLRSIAISMKRIADTLSADTADAQESFFQIGRQLDMGQRSRR